MTGFTEASFAVLEELKANQTREWYHANKDRLVAEVRQPFEDVLLAASDALEDTDRPLRGSRLSMFRTRRDTRFSPDKTPYKTHVSGMLTASGAKEALDGSDVYVQFDPAGGFLATGLYLPEVPVLNLVRDKMVAEPERWTAIVRDLEARDMALMGEHVLTAMPRGYSGWRDHPVASFLKLKSVIAEDDLDRAVWLEGRVVARIVRFVEATKPFGAFLREALASVD